MGATLTKLAGMDVAKAAATSEHGRQGSNRSWPRTSAFGTTDDEKIRSYHQPPSSSGRVKNKEKEKRNHRQAWEDAGSNAKPRSVHRPRKRPKTLLHNEHVTLKIKENRSIYRYTGSLTNEDPGPKQPKALTKTGATLQPSFSQQSSVATSRTSSSGSSRSEPSAPTMQKQSYVPAKSGSNNSRGSSEPARIKRLPPRKGSTNQQYFTDVIWPMLQLLGFYYSSGLYRHPKITTMSFEGPTLIRKYLCHHGIPNISNLGQRKRSELEEWVRFAHVDEHNLHSAMSGLLSLSADIPEEDQLEGLLKKNGFTFPTTNDDEPQQVNILAPGADKIPKEECVEGRHFFTSMEAVRAYIRGNELLGVQGPNGPRTRKVKGCGERSNHKLTLRLWAATCEAPLPVFEEKLQERNTSSNEDNFTDGEDATLEESASFLADENTSTQVMDLDRVGQNEEDRVNDFSSTDGLTSNIATSSAITIDQRKAEGTADKPYDSIETLSEGSDQSGQAEEPSRDTPFDAPVGKETKHDLYPVGSSPMLTTHLVSPESAIDATKAERNQATNDEERNTQEQKYQALRNETLLQRQVQHRLRHKLGPQVLRTPLRSPAPIAALPDPNNIFQEIGRLEFLLEELICERDLLEDLFVKGSKRYC